MIQSSDELILDFWAKNIEDIEEVQDTYTILIADDEEDIHKVTKLVLQDFTFESKKLEFLHAYSGKAALALIESHPDIAVIFLDVVMESDQSGLDLVRQIRNDIKNKAIRIILRTGQPGEAPEESVIRDYDINDYRIKTELTSIRLRTTLYTALRSYRDIKKLEAHQRGLEQIIKSSARMFNHDTVDTFLESILDELSNFYKSTTDIVYIRENNLADSHGFITIEAQCQNRIVAATGKYKGLIGKDIELNPDFKEIVTWINDYGVANQDIHQLTNGFIIGSQGRSKLKNFIYIEGPQDAFDYHLINLFLSNYSIALDNYLLRNLLNETQKEILFALGETIESHYEETGSHTKRLSEMMYQFALCCGYSYADSEMLRIASTMHDLGKIAIPDAILKKPGGLDPEESDIMRTHVNYGYKIMSNSDLPVLKLAAEIAFNHHEQFNGQGYPNRKSGTAIPKSARMLAIIDVYDAMTHTRVYKKALSSEETIKLILQQKGQHFDPDLVDIFMENLDTITQSSKDL